eukprot:COSAG01_NODE_16127_length_1268_cov_0.826347_1_plen_29_part_10
MGKVWGTPAVAQAAAAAAAAGAPMYAPTA